jgi:predicted Fe-Mo cluster-binding NifX family protein
MLACIPTNDGEGLDATVCEHFGSAPFFTLYDTETGEVNVISNRNAHHSHGTCHPMNQLARYKIDCVVCGGMGRRAVEALNAEGVKIYQSEEDSVRATIEKIKANKLAEIDPALACRGHGQHVDMIPRQPGRGSGFGPGLGQGGGRGGGFGRGGAGRTGRS